MIFHTYLIFQSLPGPRPPTGYILVELMAWLVAFVGLFDWLGYWLLFLVEFAGLLICWFCYWCQGTTPQWEGTYVVGWRLGSRPGMRHAVAETEVTAEDDKLT